MAELDFFTLLLPFLLSFVLFHFIMQRLPLFSGSDDGSLEDDRYSVTISLILAFFVAYFLSTQPAYQMIFVEYFGRTAIGIIGLLGLMLLLAFAGVDTSDPVPLVVILSVLAITAAFAISGGFAPFVPGGTLPLLSLSYADIMSLLFDTGIAYLLIIGGAVWWLLAYNDDEDSDKSPIRTLVEAMD